MQKSWSKLEVQILHTDERSVSKTELGEMLSTFGGVSGSIKVREKSRGQRKEPCPQSGDGEDSPT